jgi:hypothetical protein
LAYILNYIYNIRLSKISVHGNLFSNFTSVFKSFYFTSNANDKMRGLDIDIRYPV